MASVLFSPITLRGLTLPNRVVVSPMCQYNSDNGSANDWHLMHLGSFSLGCAGLVMTEMTDVNPQGRISPKCAGMWSDDNEKALKRVHDFCRQYGVAKLGVQLAHAGRKGPTTPPAAGGKPILTKEEGGWTPEAPSAIPYDTGWPVPHAMTKDDIKRCIAEFAAAAKRVDRIGYDVIELHGAHGYLAHQFLSPLSNHAHRRIRRLDRKPHALCHRNVRSGARGVAGAKTARHARLGNRLGRRRLDAGRDRAAGQES